MQDVQSYVFNSFPQLETQRLMLRQFLPSDVDTVYKMRINPNVNRFIARNAMQTPEEAENIIKKVLDGFNSKSSIGWFAEHKQTKNAIGACGYHKIDFVNARAEIGGEMLPDYWGKNFAFEAVKTIVDFGMKNMQLQTIEAWMFPQNRSAIAILNALGFRKEAHLTNYVKKGEAFSDMVIYVLHPEWFTTD